MQRLIAIMFILAGMALSTGCGGNSAANPTAGASPATVATVNGENISQSELDKELNILQGQQVLQKLIDDRLVQQAAKKENIKITDEEVKSRLEEIKKSPQYAALKSQMTEQALEERIRTALMQQKLILLEITNTEKMQIYDQNREMLEQAHVYVIAIDPKKKAEADKALAQIKAGKDFGDIAKEYSIDDVSKSQGGELGWVTRTARLDPALAQAVFTLPLNQVSSVIKGSGAYYIVKVTGRKKSYDELVSSIEDALVAMRQAQYMERLRVKADIKTKFDDAGKPAASPAAPPASPAAK